MQSGELPESLCISVEADWLALVQATTAFVSSRAQQPCHVHKVLFHSRPPVFQFLWEQGQGWLAHPEAARDTSCFAQLVRSSELFSQNFSTPSVSCTGTIQIMLVLQGRQKTEFWEKGGSINISEKGLGDRAVCSAGGWWGCKSKAKAAIKMTWS